MSTVAKPSLAALRAAKALRDNEAKEAREQVEIEALILEEKLSKELGPIGDKFEIELTPEGPFAVKLGDPKHFKALEESNVTWEDKYAFVAAQLVDVSEAKMVVLMERRGLVVRLCDALIRLHRAQLSGSLGKA